MKMVRVEHVRWFAGAVLLFIVMFGHMTALQYMALGVLAFGTFAAARLRSRGAVLRWPLVLPFGAWALWTAGAVAWSAFPSVSLHSWFDEVLYPLVAFWGFWMLGTQSEHPQYLVLVNWLACALLSFISFKYWGQLQPPTVDIGLLHFYNRVGHTSTLALFAIPLFTGFLLCSQWRVIGIAGLALCFFIGLATLNRFFWPTACITLLIALCPLYWRHPFLSLLIILCIGLAGIGTLELAAQIRYGRELQPLHTQGIKIDGRQLYVPKALVGIEDTLSSDTRPKVWAFYRSAGVRHTWFGVGFGKPLPGMAYRAQMPASLLAIEPQAPTHAHNLFLNTWLQTGLVGLVLQSLLLLALAYRFWRSRSAEPWLCAAGIALVVGMIAKNSTDDFMWQTTMLAFWSFAGLLLGSCEKRTRLPQCLTMHSRRS